MQDRLLPLFPLQAVVFPRTNLPLHIFEERYKEMINGAIRDNSEFGVVLTKDEGIVNAGCTVIVEKVVKAYTDGRMDVLTSGKRRFEIVMLNEERSFLRGSVEFFDDDDSEPPPVEVKQRVLVQYRSLLELGEMNPFAEPVLTDPQLSFQLALMIQDLDFLQLLLRTRSEGERLKHLAEFLADYVPKRREATRMKRLAPLNGHGPAPPGL